MELNLAEAALELFSGRSVLDLAFGGAVLDLALGWSSGAFWGAVLALAFSDTKLDNE